MVEVEIRTPTYDEESQTISWHAVALLRAEGEEITVYGDDHTILQFIPVMSITHGKTITAEDDVEEWARSLPYAYRSGDLVAVVLHDDDPPELPDEDDVVEPGLPDPPLPSFDQQASLAR